MEKYEEFIETYGRGEKYQEFKSTDIKDSDLDLLPPEIIAILKSEGISSYGKGYLWTLSPNEYVDWLNDWLPFEEKCIPFMRTALADILFVRNKEIMILNSNSGLIDYTIDEVDMFFNHFITSQEYLVDVFDKNIYDELSEVKLTFDECYGYTPLLSLGGGMNVQNLKKVKMREYLDLVSKSSEVRFFKH